MPRRLATVLLVLALPSLARSQKPRPRVHVEIDGCGQAEDGEIRRILGIELRAELWDAPAGASADTTRVHIACSEQAAELRVEDPITRKSLVRSIDLRASAPRARARLVALASSELVSTSWTELELTPQPSVEPAGPRPSPEAVGAARDAVLIRTPALERRSFRVMASMGTQVMFDGGGPLLGGGARVGLGDAAHPWGFELDGLVAHGSDSTPLGSVSVDTQSGAASLLYHFGLGSIATAYVGAGARLGGARLTGEPTDTATVRAGTRAGPWAGPLLKSGLGLALTRHLRADIEAELGYALAAVTGKVLTANVGIQGAWLGLVLGFGVVP